MILGRSATGSFSHDVKRSGLSERRQAMLYSFHIREATGAVAVY